MSAFPRLLKHFVSLCLDSDVLRRPGFLALPVAGTIDESIACSIADEFQAARHAPGDTAVAASYQQFVSEVLDQWQRLIASELIIEFWTGSGDAYGDVSPSRAMIADVRDGHLWVQPTYSAHGESTHAIDQRENPLMQDAGVKISGRPAVFNDLFRALHDVFGHALHDFSFGPLGEENAWRMHRMTFSSLALDAMTTETRGQNSWVNFGPHLRDETGCPFRKGHPAFLPPKTRPFSEQKMTLLPRWIANGQLPTCS